MSQYYTSNYLSTSNLVTPFLQSSAGYKINKPGLDYFFKKTQLPMVGRVDLSRFVTDADLKKLERAVIKDTLPHRQTAFFKDNIATSTTEMMVATLIGEGLSIAIEGKDKAKQIIEDWNDHINEKHQTIEDFVKSTWYDNQINPGSLWRTFVDLQNKEQIVDLQRVSMANIKIQEHPTRGWRRFVQRTNIPIKPQNKSRFYRKNTWEYFQTEFAETIIPDEPECCIYIQLFKQAPVSTVLPFLIYKRWITWFMRKFAEKYWAPFLIGYIGDPANGYMPPSKADQDQAIGDMLETVRKVRDFAGAAVLGTNRIEVLETNVKQASIYVDYLEYLNKEITYGLLSSMALREARGRTAATSDVVQQIQLRFVRGVRENIALPLRRFYSKVLLPAYNINDIKPTAIKIGWPEVRTEDVGTIMKAVSEGAKIGAFRDAKEIRKILTPIWRHIDENITEKEAADLKKTFLEINSPSRAEGDAPQSRAGASKKPAKKKSVATNK